MADPGAVASALLDLVRDVAAEQGVTLPRRQYVTPGASGQEAWDCEQVVVGLVSLNPSTAAAGTSAAASRTGQHPGGVLVASLALRVEIVRAAPMLSDDGKLPTAAAMHAAGLAALADLEVLRVVLVRAQRTQVLTDGAGDVSVGQVIPAGPEGGYAGLSAAVTVVLL